MYFNSMQWIFLAIFSAFFTALRYLYIKRWCVELPAELMIFSTRLFGACIMLPFAMLSRPGISDVPLFSCILTVTVLVTMAATIAQIRIIQTRAISRSVPYLSLTPLFMIPWTMLFFREIPRPAAFIGIILCCSGAYILNIRNRGSLFLPIKALVLDGRLRIMLVSAAGLGLTTACDRIAIESSSAMTYSFAWSCASTIVMFCFLARYAFADIKRYVVCRHTFAQAVFWACAFVFQMTAVQKAAGIPSGVTYVKTLTLFNVLLTVVFGGRLFNEGRLRQSILASVLMVAGATITLLFK